MDLYEAIRNRRSIRVFRKDSVDRDVLARILGAAALAPSAMNSQPWTFHVVSGETRDELGKAMSATTLHLQEYIGVMEEQHLRAAEEFFANLGGAPIVVVVAVAQPSDELGRINTYVAAGAAVENLLLAAEAEGLGSCNITSSYWVRESLSTLLGVGEREEIVSIILLGHPGESPDTTPRKSDAAIYHD